MQESAPAPAGARREAVPNGRRFRALARPGSGTPGRVPAAGDDVVITAAGARVLRSRETPLLRSVTLSFSGWKTRLLAGTLTVQRGAVREVHVPSSVATSRHSSWAAPAVGASAMTRTIGSVLLGRT